MKKALALIIALAMVLGTMSGMAFAAGETLGNADFDSNAGKTVFDGTNYYATLNEALKAVHGTKGAVLYCKPDADVGSLTHGHVCKDLTVYGNGAYISGGEQDFEIDSPAASGTNCVGLTEAVTLKVDNLTGAGAWGTKNSAYAITFEFTNCENMGKIFYAGTAGELNIHMKDCSFNGNTVSACKVYTNTNGTITLDNVDFAGVDQPVALNNKSTGTQTIVLKDCDFTNCGAATADWTVPVSVKSSVSGGTSVLTVDNCTFVGTVENSIGQDADILLDYGVGTTTAAIVNTAAKVGTETAANDATYSETKTTDAVIIDNVTVVPAAPAARIGDNYYKTIQEAIDAADANDVVTLTTDISAEVMPTADGIGTDSNCFVHTDANDVVTLDLNGKTISVKGSDDAQYDTLAIKNYGNLTITDSSADKTGTITLAFDGTQEYGTSQIHSTILNFGTLTINGGNITNTATTGYSKYAIYNYSWGGNAILTINDANVSSDNGDAIIQAIYDDFSKNVNTVTIKDGTFDGGVLSWYQGACAPDGASITIEGGVFTGEEYALRLRGMSSNVLKVDVQGGTFTAPAGVNAIKADAAAKFISGGSFSTSVDAYLADGYELTRTADGYDVIKDGTDNPGADQADSISVEYKDITKDGTEGEKTYEIVLKANAGDEIHELASADLTFAYTANPIYNGAIDFTVAPADDFSMSRVDGTNRYMFNYDGVGAYEGSDNAITIGTITVTGYGTYTIATADVTTNIVNATTLNDNLVDYYVANGATDNDATTGALDISGSVSATIKVPTRTLKINIAFPNEVKKQAAVYQDMKVEITGTIEGVNQTETYDLGENMTADGKYVVTESRLVLNNAYTVTVSGAGYRTARYTVTMTDSKELNFWNNVMDEKKAVEPGKASSEVTKNFLAGDIVKDNDINIYDLSAVVSYFATTTDITAKSDYAKYDLNRDGVIDSKDVAYVLVSWGE